MAKGQLDELQKADILTKIKLVPSVFIKTHFWINLATQLGYPAGEAEKFIRSGEKWQADSNISEYAIFSQNLPNFYNAGGATREKHIYFIIISRMTYKA